MTTYRPSALNQASCGDRTSLLASAIGSSHGAARATGGAHVIWRPTSNDATTPARPHARRRVLTSPSVRSNQSHRKLAIAQPATLHSPRKWRSRKDSEPTTDGAVSAAIPWTELVDSELTLPERVDVAAELH